MVTEKPTWGAPARIHGDLLMLGFNVSEQTACRWVKQSPRGLQAANQWLAFLRNHRESIAAIYFFTAPMVTFRVLYCFFVIGHKHGRIVYFNVTRHRTSQQVVQQLREAFPFQSVPRYLIFDHDAKYGMQVPEAVRSLGLNPVRTSFESPYKTTWRSRGWKAADETCSITLSR